VNPRRRAVAVRLVLVLTVSVAGFWLLQAPARHLETSAAVAVNQRLSDRVYRATETSIGVVPFTGRPFQAIVTPTCSSLSSVIAIGCLAALCSRGRRRVVALLAAVATVVIGNVARIATAVLVGILAGRSSLILFHDWVGSVFAFAYTLGGYVVLLSLFLPDRPSSSEDAPCNSISSRLSGPVPAWRHS
jgi:carbamoyl-phosphate synthase large subunit